MNDRARVPFALVGVVVLAASVGVTATVGTVDPGDPMAVDDAMAGATAEAATELRAAADEAATNRAAAPVLTPANTTAGRALNDSRPFRDALRLDIYLRTAARLDAVEIRRGDVVATASLPDVESTTDGYREAIERVHVEPDGAEGEGIRVELEGVMLRATIDGETVATDELDPTFVVANPALSMHERTERFERRVNAPVTHSGLAQRLTARLYPIAWARGYAQYGGAPIATVVGTRHVELATNDALLAEQRATFGSADPDGDHAVRAAGQRVAAADIVNGIGGDDEWIDVVLGAADLSVEGSSERWRGDQESAELTVGVNETADHAFDDVIRGDSDDDLEGIMERAHTVESRISTERDVRDVRVRESRRPGADWELVGRSTDRRVDLRRVDGSVRAPSNWTVRDAAVFETTVVERTTREWRRGEETTRTGRVTETDSRITVSVLARTAPLPGVPAGELDGILREATERAMDRATRDAGGLRGAARRAAIGDSPTSVVTETAPSSVDPADLEAALRTERAETRNRSVSVPVQAVAVGRESPADRLRSALSDRRPSFGDEAPLDVQTRTRLALRVTYLDAVDARLEARGESHDATSDGLADAVGAYLGSDRFEAALGAHRPHRDEQSEPPTDPAGTLEFTVSTGPSYLPTDAVNRDRLDVRGGGEIRPLATRNVNVFTSPHGDVASAVIDVLPFLGTDGVHLETAAHALAATGETPSPSQNRLASEVESAADHVRGELRTAMIREGVASHRARSALEPEPEASIAEEAINLVDGTAATRAADRVAKGDERDDHLERRLHIVAADALADDAARPDATATDEAAAAAREAARDELEDLVAEGAESAADRARRRALGEQLASIPAGLPIAPIPGHWWATANVWYVEVGGTYERFAVRSNRGGPSGATTYLREGQAAELSHDGDRVHLGYADRLEFRTETAVVVIVPPGGTGVGDTDGVVDDRSPGWPP